MKKNNSKKWIKTITITTAVLVFAAGAVFALKSAGTANTDKDSADTVVAAANEATDLVVKETVSEKETEVITETAATEATTEEATETVTEQTESSEAISETERIEETAKNRRIHKMENCRDSATDRGCNRSSSGARSYRGCCRVTCCTDSIRCKSCTGYSRN